MSKASSLPPDIWTCIFAYIPPEAFRVIGSVNQQFYAAASKARFREVSMSRYSDWEHELKPLLDPSIARNVRSLRIDARLLQEHPVEPTLDIPPPQAHARTPILTRLHYALRPSSRPQPPIRWPPLPMPCSDMPDASRIELFLDILRNLTCLEEYVMGSDDFPAGRDKLQEIHRVWATFAPSLRTLRLFTAAGSFHALVPPPGIQFAHLRVLHLSSTCQNLSSANTPIRLAPVCEFINGLHETLEELHFGGVVFPWSDWFFQQLHHFKRLHSLTIRADTRHDSLVTVSHGVHEFINKHQMGIHHLRLYITSHFLPFNLSELHVPNLTSLEIARGTLVTNRDDTKDFFEHISHSLAKLFIKSLLPRRDLYILLSSFPAENCLKTLVLSQSSFDADLILALASCLPRLRSLTLHVDAEVLSLPPTLHNLSSPDNEYRASLLLDLASWELEDITITRCEKCERPVLWTVMALVAMCVPSIRSFCGNGHTRVPDPRQRWPQAGGRWRCYEGICIPRPGSRYDWWP